MHQILPETIFLSQKDLNLSDEAKLTSVIWDIYHIKWIVFKY